MINCNDSLSSEYKSTNRAPPPPPRQRKTEQKNQAAIGLEPLISRFQDTEHTTTLLGDS